MADAIIRNYARYGDRTVYFQSLEHFLASNIHSGINVIPYGEELLELRIVDNQAPSTVVMFHAAIDPRKTTLPVFIGQQLASNLEANFVYISEPVLDKGVGIGWFCGDQNRPLQTDLTKVLRHVHAGLAASRNLIFFGASAGGFAALYYSYQFPGSLAVVSNPQTNIEHYHLAPVTAYRDACWSGQELSNTGITYDLVPLYRKGFRNSVAYLQNSRDELHLEKHFIPWANGVSHLAEQWKYILGDWGEGHAPAPIFLLVGIIGWAIECDGDWREYFTDPDFSSGDPAILSEFGLQ